MNKGMTRVRELAAWGLDQDEYRPSTWRGNPDLSCSSLAKRDPLDLTSALLESGYVELHQRLKEQQPRTDLRAEMTELDWSLGVIDLRLLLAFQRRIVLDSEALRAKVPAANDWDGLMDLCFGNPKPVACEVVRTDASILLRSANPNLHFRFTNDSSSPLTIHTGSPFLEVAEYRDRWFLRDGYHRAFCCLRAGVFHLPSVIVRAGTLEELGAIHPWFFPEKVLFSTAPPRVADFLDDALVIEYDRPPLIKTVRITVEEAYTLQGEVYEHCN